MDAQQIKAFIDAMAQSDLAELEASKDGWTLRASDGSRGAHSEHTIAITENGPIVFTDRTNL